jgi:hypothetical protein
MHAIYLVNEGSVAVGVMAVALFFAFGLVIVLGAYVVYCDRLNRAGERALVGAGEAEPAVSDPPAAAVAAPAAEAEHPARRPRAKPPESH